MRKINGNIGNLATAKYLRVKLPGVRITLYVALASLAYQWERYMNVFLAAKLQHVHIIQKNPSSDFGIYDLVNREFNLSEIITG